MVEFGMVVIDPQQAETLLTLNIKNNRNIKSKKVMQYADDILNNRWIDDSGEVIKFNTKGELIDGQNRLKAVITANMPVKMWVAKNCSDKSFMVIDAGNRTITDTFKINNVPFHNLAAAITRGLFVFKYNKENNLKTSVQFSGQKYHIPASSQKLYEYYLEKQNIIETTIDLTREIIYNRDRTKLISPSNLFLLSAILIDGGVDFLKLTTYLNQFCFGVNASPAVAAARDYFMEQKTKRNIIPIASQIEVLYKSWNNYLSNQTRYQKIKIDNQIPNLNLK